LVVEVEFQDGRANNIGAIETENGLGFLETTTSLSQFALLP
jgi:hypothetical protein